DKQVENLTLISLEKLKYIKDNSWVLAETENSEEEIEEKEEENSTQQPMQSEENISLPQKINNEENKFKPNYINNDTSDDSYESMDLNYEINDEKDLISKSNKYSSDSNIPLIMYI